MKVIILLIMSDRCEPIYIDVFKDFDTAIEAAKKDCYNVNEDAEFELDNFANRNEATIVQAYGMYKGECVAEYEIIEQEVR